MDWKFTQSEAASFFGVTRQTVLDWMNEGLPHKKRARNQVEIDPKVAFDWVKTNKLTPRGGDRERKLRAEADLAEIERDKARGLLVEVTEVEKAMVEEFTRARTKLLAVPSKLAPQMVGLKSAPQARAMIEAHIWEALRELSGEIEE